MSKLWTELRSMDLDQETDTQGTSKIMPITIRTLESIIRLSTAHAKLRLGNTVTKRDC